ALADTDQAEAPMHATRGGKKATKKVTRSAAPEKTAKKAVRKAAKKTPKKTPKKAPRTDAARPLPTLSSPSKVLFPDTGTTKQDVWDYYRAVAAHLLPEIAGRPLSIIRCPSGTAKACFFQKHHTAGLELVSLVRLKEESGNNADYLVVEDEAGLMELVQFNTLEFHPWGAHAHAPDV